MRSCCFMVWIWMGMIVSVYAQDDHLSPNYFSTLDALGRVNAGLCTFTIPQPLNREFVEICNALSELPKDADAQLRLRKKMQLLRQSVRQYAVKWKNHPKVYKSLGWGPITLDNKSYRKEWDKAAEFPGMNPTDYVIQNMVYPAEMLEKNSWSMVLVLLELDAMGYITNVSLQGMSSRSPEIGEEVIRVIYSMSPWIPAKKSGKPVSSVYRFAVPFNPVAYRERMGLK